MELFDHLKKHYTKGLPFVAYRKPASSYCIAMFQNEGSLETDEDLKASGFVMAPFSEGIPTIRIRPDEARQEALDNSCDPIPFDRTSEESDPAAKEEYLEKVENALEVIESGELQKVVLSRKITNHLNPDPFSTFQILLRQFPEAFCYFLYHPQVGVWMGASPETLLQHNKSQITTVSLAGTQKASKDKDVEWSPKELREQEYVTRYIERALEGLSAPAEIAGPVTVKAGNLLHLKTQIKAANPGVGLSEIVKALHPTPAVCGIPAEKAKAYLMANEGYPRAYYTGFLGEVNWGENQESHLFVNLRCMNLKDEQVQVYVGGGLVEGSDPELEWQETVYKSESMLHLLRNSTEGLG